MRHEWLILVDEREKKPLIFPDHLVVWDPDSPALNARSVSVRLRTHRTRLLTGDYQLQGAESRVIIERKASLDELSVNLLTSTGRRRFLAELARLRDTCAHPWILLEGTPLSLSRTRDVKTPISVTRDTLLHACLEYGVQLQLLPGDTVPHRRAAAEWAAALLIAGATRCTPSPVPLRSELPGPASTPATTLPSASPSPPSPAASQP